jgi:hypothetical protein
MTEAQSTSGRFCFFNENLNNNFFFYSVGEGWSPIGSTWHCAHNRSIVQTPGDYDDGEIGGTMIGRGN